MEQPEQPIGRPAAQLVGESAVPGAHQNHGSRPDAPHLQPTSVRAGAATDVGLLRKINQDALLVAPPVYVVADGMGGHDGGEVASALVVDQFAAMARRSVAPAEAVSALHDALAAGQARITEYVAAQRAAGHPRFSAGTTVVAAVQVRAPGAQFLIANVGDSRAYCLLDDELQQVTVDHSVVQELIDSGRLDPADAAHHPERNVVTRALGGMTASVPDLFQLSVPPGARILLCSDGVSGMLDHDAMTAILVATADARDAAGALVRAAVSAGGRDNATAVVIDVMGWADDNPDDSARERASPEEKLGILP